MIVVEYRVPLPLSLAEYNRALRYVVARVAESTTGVSSGEGVEILVNERFEEGDVDGMGESGVHTLKVLRFRSRLPALMRRLLPMSITEIREESWFGDGEGSRCRTVYWNQFLGDRFYLSIESNHVTGVCTEDNAVGMSDADLRKRNVLCLDIAGGVPRKIATEDPSTFVSEKTGRGKLIEGWWQGLVGEPVEAAQSDSPVPEKEESDGGELSAELKEEGGRLKTEQQAETSVTAGAVMNSDSVSGEGDDDDVDDDDFCDALSALPLESDDKASSSSTARGIPPSPSSASSTASSSSSSSTAVDPPVPEPSHCMTCYKVVRMEFTGFGLRRFVQRWATRAVIPNSLIDIHRKIFCWMDEWVDLSLEEIEALEAETAETTRARLQEHDAAKEAGELNLSCSSDTAGGGQSSGASGSGTASTSAASSAFEFEYMDE